MMAQPIAMVPGGVTETVKNSGGGDTYLQLQVALAGKTMAQAVYGVTRCMSSIGLNMEDRARAVSLLRQMLTDAENELELNWPKREALMAEARASFHSNGGAA